MRVALANVAHTTLRIMSLSSQIVLGGFQEAPPRMLARKIRGAKRFPSMNLICPHSAVAAQCIVGLALANGIP
jgi:hypothetical protein